jgi:hypothetical protein
MKKLLLSLKKPSGELKQSNNIFPFFGSGTVSILFHAKPQRVNTQVAKTLCGLCIKRSPDLVGVKFFKIVHYPFFISFNPAI